MIYIYILFGLVCGSGYLSDSYDNSINLSFSNLTDNETYFENNNGEEQLLELKPKLKSLYFNLVFRGKYELGIHHQYNTSFINGYNLPYRGSYNFLYFKYHLKERDYFPLNLSFNFKYGESASYRFSNDYVFNLKTYGFSIYKELGSFKYPLLPILTFEKIDSYINNISKYDYSIIDFELLIKIIVDNSDNNRRRDVIYLGPKITSIGNDQSIGFIVGIYHPIK